MGRNFFYNLLNKLFPLHLPGIDLVHKIKKDFRLEILKRQIVKFCLDLGNTQTLGDGSIDIHRLLRLLLLLLRFHELQCS